MFKIDKINFNQRIDYIFETILHINLVKFKKYEGMYFSLGQLKVSVFELS